jgi:hypothetical protein
MSSATSAASKNIVEVFAISIVLAGVVASLLHKLSASLVHLSPRARFNRISSEPGIYPKGRCSFRKIGFGIVGVS